MNGGGGKEEWRRKEETFGVERREKRAIHQNQKSATASAKGRLLSLLFVRYFVIFRDASYLFFPLSSQFVSLSLPPMLSHRHV